MNVDISIVNFTGEDATYYRIRYARIDNVASPVYTPIAANITAAQFPYSITSVANGQYSIGILPVYADGRTCQETFNTTSPCTPIIALNAVQVNSNLQITYSANGDVPQVYLTVNYPNGGSYQQAYTNGANDSTILIPIPNGVNGTFRVYMQSICDPDTNFYSSLSAGVNVEVGGSTVVLTSDAYPIVITNITGISGFSMPSSLTTGNSINGTHSAFTSAISATFTGTPGTSENASLYVNGTLTSCQNIPNTDGGTVVFPSATYYESDVLEISFNIGSC